MYKPFGGNSLGRATASSGTVINHLVPPRRSAITRVSTARATAAATAHTLTCLRPIGKTTASADAATSQAVVNVTANPGPSGNALAANDWVAIRHAVDGITRLYQVGSIAGTAVTLSANLTVAVTNRDEFWMFGVAADTDPRAGAAHPGFALGANAVTIYTDTVTGVIASIGKDEPILLQSNNATNAGSLDQTTWAYTHE
jgi:hypothetical protein